jgi:ketosteroid isomerase-like protein
MRVENDVEVVRVAFDSLARGGVEAMLLHVHERFEMSTPGELASEPDTYRGHDGVRRWFDSFYEAMDEVALELDQMQAVGDRVAVALRIVARGRATSLEVVQDAAALCTVEDAKILRIDFAATWDDALNAVAL